MNLPEDPYSFHHSADLIIHRPSFHNILFRKLTYHGFSPDQLDIPAALFGI